MSLYLDHLATLQQQAERALARCGHDALVIAAGIEKYAFLDDRPYLFQPNPHFKHWLPLTNHPHSWIAVRPGRRPRVVYYQPHDYWHVPPEAPSGEWVAAVELVVIRDNVVSVRGLDALEGTPVLDIKPYIDAFDRKDVTMPSWVAHVMEGYF